MKNSFKTGVSFGLTSGIITTLGLIVGLDAGTHSKLAVVGGIITIAIADAFSDALGIHISQESQDGAKAKEIWEATFATFVSKFIFALTFIVPLFLFQLATAILVDVGWGFLLLAIFNYFLAKSRQESPSKTIIEHLIIALVVVLVARFVGDWTGRVFGGNF